jgi:hypothetical protein
MPRKPSTFTQSEIARAIRAVRQTGLSVARVEVAPGGGVIVIPSESTGHVYPSSNPWDETLTDDPNKKRSA